MSTPNIDVLKTNATTATVTEGDLTALFEHEQGEYPLDGIEKVFDLNNILPGVTIHEIHATFDQETGKRSCRLSFTNEYTEKKIQVVAFQWKNGIIVEGYQK